MKNLTAVVALLASLSVGSAFAEESVDCFYEVNVTHPLCKK